MECPNCHEPIDEGAAFCGNCGHALQPPAASAAATVPAYAIAVPAKHKGETTALLSVLMGAAGIVGSVFMAAFGIALGLAGLVTGTLSRHSPKRALSTAGLIISSVSVMAGIAVLVYNLNPGERLNKITPQRQEGPVRVSSGADLSTPCYAATFAEELNISRRTDGCSSDIYNGQTFEVSSEVYKINASQSQIRTESGFQTLAKKALENDVSTNLKTFTITGQRETTFAGSPAYVVEAVDRTNNIALVEVAVFHQAPTGDNVFIILHGNNGEKSDLQVLESQWIWK